MHILALQAYYGGSHLAAMEGWIEHSNFEFTVLDLPPRHWKWRMRHSAWTFAEEVNTRWKTGQRWDAVFCTDMLNFAEFKGLVDPEIAESALHRLFSRESVRLSIASLGPARLPFWDYQFHDGIGCGRSLV